MNIPACLSSVLVPPDSVEPLAPECRDNSECPVYNACINRKCLNPCAVTDPCATNAFCKVQGHEPVCTCPAGYIGDPRVSCTKRKFNMSIQDKCVYLKVVSLN